MKCNQCEHAAIYVIGPETSEIPLCLHCYSKWKNIQDMDYLQNAISMNQALDDMDMVTGMSTRGGRIPVRELARAMQKSPTLNNINVTESQIGVLNTGSIGKIDAMITLSQKSDTEHIAEQIKAFTETIISSSDIDDDQKGELIDLTESVAEQVVGQRKTTVIVAVMKAIKEKVDGVLALSNASDKLWSSLKGLFELTDKL